MGEFVKSIFSKAESGDKIKRLHDDSDEEEEDMKVKKVSKLESATDHLVEKKPSADKAVWEKSIGTLSSKKGGLGVLVKKKTPATAAAPAPTVVTNISNNSKTTSATAPTTTMASTSAAKPTSGSNALGLLGNYSGSSSGSESE